MKQPSFESEPSCQAKRTRLRIVIVFLVIIVVCVLCFAIKFHVVLKSV